MICSRCGPSRPVPCLLAVVLLLAVPSPRAGAQTAYLAALEGPPVTVRYAPGSLDRAAAVKRRFERLIEQTGTRRWWKQPLLVVDLLEDDAWRRSALAGPFGLPAISTEGSLALPAWGTPETVALWLDLLDGRLPPAPDPVLRGTSEEAASLAAADLVGEVEGSRLVLARLGLVGAEPWIDDLLACAMAVSALGRYEAARSAETHRVFTVLARKGDSSADERLRRLYWIAAAERIGAETGNLPARPLLKLARKGPLAAATLFDEFPWLAEWAAGEPAD